MLTGSVASSAHGAPRSTRDLDIVIAAGRNEVLSLLAHFPSSEYYADEQQALEALANKSQFNVIDFTTGWKVDFIFAGDSEYGRAAMARRRAMNIAGCTLDVASAEDIVISKLQWAKLSSSERQLHDAAGVVKTQGEKLNLEYIERWVKQLSLDDQWKSVRESL